MNAKILALCGTISAAVSFVGDALSVPHALGLAGAIMLLGNVIVLFHREK